MEVEADDDDLVSSLGADEGKTSGRIRSVVWNRFKRIQIPSGEWKAKCNNCRKLYVSHSHTSGTFSLRSHVRRGCLKPGISKTLSILLKVRGEDGRRLDLRNWRFDQTAIRKALVYMIIIDELLFKFVEHLGFKYFMSIACPRFIIPSRRTVTRDSWDFYLDMKAKLKEVFMASDGRVCLTTDTWTSIKQINYMCLTAHFIDKEWILRKKIIGFRQVFSHEGVAIAQALMSCLDEWGIDKVFSIMVDSASSNDTAIQCIKTLFEKQNTSICNGQFLHVRCVAHLINLVVSDGLEEISTSVKQISKVVRYVKQSPARLQKFYGFVGQNITSRKSLCLDVLTRWNSTYLMLQAAENFETALEMYALSDPQYRVDLVSKVGVPNNND
ncbi:Putative AC transposase [Linum grandiflorum]